MLIGSGIILAALILGLLFLIGIFNKKIAKLARVILFYIKRLRLNRKNMAKLPKTAKKIYPVLMSGPRGRGLFRKKISKNYEVNKFTSETLKKEVT